MKTIIFIYGPAGAGKTTLAKALAVQQNKDYYMTATGKDPFENYRDEPCIIIDDVSADNIQGKAVLKIIDPYNSVPVSSRYFNKMLQADFLIITSTISPADYWAECKEKDATSGPVEQLYRRLNGGVYYIDEHSFKMTMYDSNGLLPLSYSLDYPDDLLKNIVREDADTRAAAVLSSFGFCKKEEPQPPKGFVVNNKGDETLPFTDKPER